MDIKNCPFCGSAGKLKREWSSDHDYQETMRVICSNCWAKGMKFNEYKYIHPSKVSSGEECGYICIQEQAKQQAIEAWNKRSN